MGLLSVRLVLLPEEQKRAEQKGYFLVVSVVGKRRVTKKRGKPTESFRCWMSRMGGVRMAVGLPKGSLFLGEKRTH
jgi:hypothetical protein